MARWMLPLTAILIGAAVGIGVFTFGYAKGASYLTNDPAACANCHVMDDHYSAWLKSSHRAVAGCNDCHTPHNFVNKYYTKALNGFWHSFYFTTGTYPYPLRITARNREVTEGACRYCHEPITETIDHAGAPAGTVAAHVGGDDEPLSCIRCHANVGHRVR